MSLLGRHLLSAYDLSKEDIRALFSVADEFMKTLLGRRHRKLPTLRGKTVLMAFFEPSTRTQVSFELAAKRLSMDAVSVGKGGSAVQKGESLLDTVRNVEAMGLDAVVVRHPSPGAAHLLARKTQVSVINAGDGPHQHPTQALLDLYVMERVLGGLDGKTVLYVGDILHSRVARSGCALLPKVGARVLLAGPGSLVPREGLGEVVELREGLGQADVIVALRLQRERFRGAYIPSVEEYRRFWGLGRESLARAKPGAVLMHPGPVNWEVELLSRGPYPTKSLILDQVKAGVAIRMAVFYYLLSGDEVSH